MWPLAAERVIPLKELRWSRRVLTSPCGGREISRSPVLVDQARLIAFADRPFEKSGVGPRTRRHIERPSTNFRLGGVFSCGLGLPELKMQRGEERCHGRAPAADLSCPHCCRQSRFSQHRRFRHTPRPATGPDSSPLIGFCLATGTPLFPGRRTTQTSTL